MSRVKPKPVEPDDSLIPEAEAIEVFEKAGWPNADAQWLGPVALGIYRTQPDEGGTLHPFTRNNLEVLAGTRAKEQGPDHHQRSMLLLYLRLCGIVDLGVQDQLEHLRSVPSAEVWQRLATEFRSRGADFGQVLSTGAWPNELCPAHELVSVFRSFAHHPSPESHMPLVVRVMHVLYRGAQVDLTRVIDVVSLQHMGERLKVALACGDQRAQASGWDEIRTKPDLGPQSLVPWLIAIGPEALARVVPILERGEDGNAATNLAFGFRAAIEQWLGTKGCHSANFLEGGPDLAHATRQVLNHLFARWKPDTADVPPALRRIWMWFGWCTCDADLDAWRSNPPDSAGPLLHAATADAAAARKILARAGQADEQPGAESPAALELQAELDHLRVCVYLLFFLGGVWPALKVMVLWLRSSTVPAVARDLRHWHEHGLEAPPEPWSALVAWPTNLFHVFVGDEQRSDHELVALRGQFASFCLERLVDRWKQSQREAAEQSGQQRTDEDMLERSPEWRYCYVRAVSSLGINPEGKGHRVLHKASQIDPDPDVREAARQGYERMRRGVGLPEDTSPRRAIMSALWWIRQAHLLGLGIQPDPDGAQRTRIKELSRTKEAERYDPTASRQPTE